MNRDDAALLYLFQRTQNEVAVAAHRACLGVVADIHQQRALMDQHRREQAFAEARRRAVAALLGDE